MSSRAHRSARHGRRSRRGLRIPVIAAGVATVAALGAAWAGTQALRSPGSTAASASATASASVEAQSRTELAPGTVFVPPADPSSAPATPSASAPAPAPPAEARGSAGASPSPAGSKPGPVAAAPAAKREPAASAPKTTAKAAFAPGYDSAADGQQALDAALRAAAADGKQVLLDFGANWCGNCKAADKVFGQPATNALLNDSYHLVKIDIGSQNSANFSILRKYSSGGGSYKMPVLIVLSPPGTVRTDTHQSGNPALTADGLGSFLRQWS
ncbi:thioredoxin family protein [Streptomyces goshikiensis]|uniref:thioredoxin family protein n=1 Tax=Streptomyces goshikiensis TaxID=1942 RepID=UPI00167711C0|nr:thioredoxin family protein [Streptomyces goshikiensis]